MPHQPSSRGASIEVMHRIFSFNFLPCLVPLAGSIVIVYDLLRHGAFDDTRILSKNALMAWKWSYLTVVFCFAIAWLFLLLHTSVCSSQGFCWLVLSIRTGVVAWISAIQREYILRRALGEKRVLQNLIYFMDLSQPPRSCLPLSQDTPNMLLRS